MNDCAGNERGLYEHYKFEVDKGQTALRVDKFLCDKLNDFSRNKIQEAAENGQLFANGKAIKSNYKVKPGDVISIEMAFPKQEITIIPQDIPLNVLYEDESVMVINKAAGMVVHPGCGNYSGTLVNAVAWHLRDTMQFEENDPRPGLVHRIDKDTSGLLVLAKNEAAKTALASQFFHKTSERTYVAVVWGRLKEPTGTITGYMGRSLKDRKIRALFSDETGGKWSVTHYKVLEELGYVSVVECKLETGRTHQIRVHFKSIGHPLFNDETYGGNQILRGTTFANYKQFVQNCFELCPRQALHAKTLGFKHPVTGEYMQFDSEIPADMQELMRRWRNYIAQREV
ncbi:MAG: RluA family pseudouridine synthase [Bacteroidales bacterium]|jgi:23S rRNA pseudouridine1911/1915/1917 synthase|nr:RluA family pseudouridine synthase [Bacteroidales bacterium]